MNSKRSAAPSPGKSALVVLIRESWWFALIAGILYLAVVLYSYDPSDPGWSHTTTTESLIHNAGGRFGAWLADILLYLFGLSAWWWLAFGLVVVYWGYRRMDGHSGHPLPIAAGGFLVLIVASSSLESLRMYHLKNQLPYQPGGMLGALISGWTHGSFGFTGATLLLLLAASLGFSWFIGRSWLGIAEWIGTSLENTVFFVQNTWQQWEDRKAGQVAQIQREEHVAEEKKRIEEHEPVRIEPAVFEIPKSERVAAEKQVPLFADLPSSPIPPLSLLDEPKPNQETVSPETIEFTSRLIERKLAEFGVKINVVAAYPGPVITRYEVEPSVGVKGSQIVNLSKDLARALSLVSIRVVETIPGKNYMGLELPNQNRQTVLLGEILGSTAYNDPPSPLTLAMGKDIAGKPVVANLAKMPHLLVAGTTGSGKSVAINAMILSLLYKATAREVRLILVDPKMLELSVYDGIPHLLAPVVTDMKQAANALNWCVQEMERRYRLMSALGVRNLSGYNQKVIDAAKGGTPLTNPHSLTPDSPEPLDELPYLVVVIDELADLMMVAGKKIEELIARLAQKARAAGIHLILATQRPSVDVITGLIKANIPTRVAFQVSSKIDSRTILDQMGAESLLGQGDMLYLPPGTGYPQRVHGAFVSDDEVHRIVEYIKSTGEPDYIEGILDGSSDSEEPGAAGGGSGGSADAEADPLYDEAVGIVLKNRRASISLVQRHLRIGYNRAARLIEQMENAGLVSQMQSNGNREVLAPSRED